MWAIQTLKVNFKRLMKTIIIFSPTYSSSELKVAGFSPGRLEYKAGTYPGQDTCPSQGAPGPPRPSTANTHSHSFRLGQLRHAISHAHLWDVGGNWVLREHLCRHEENVQTPHRQWPLPWISFFFFFFPQHYNETALLEDLLYFS